MYPLQLLWDSVNLELQCKWLHQISWVVSYGKFMSLVNVLMTFLTNKFYSIDCHPNLLLVYPQLGSEIFL